MRLLLEHKNGQQISGHSSPTTRPLLFCLLAMSATSLKPRSGQAATSSAYHQPYSLTSHTLHNPARNTMNTVVSSGFYAHGGFPINAHGRTRPLHDAPSLNNVTYQGSRVRARENAGKHVFSRKAESRRGWDGRQLTHAVGQNRFSGDPLLVSLRAS